VRMLKPLRRRDFALLWAGMSVSFLGDGVYLVAIAFQVYAITNDPAALALVGFAWSGGMVAFLLLGGVLADRFDRRRVMLAADALRLVALTGMGALGLADVVEIWHLAALAALYGAGEGLFTPAFEAIVPDIVPEDEVVSASAVRQFVHPLTMLLLGPALGGALVAATEPAVALLADAGTFVVSLACVYAMRARPRPAVAAEERPSALGELREALRFVRATPWLWATMTATVVAVLAFAGPVEVLLPFHVKNELGGDAGDFGLVLATAGAGAVAGSIWRGQRGMPRRPVMVMYVCWAVALLPVAGYGIANELWHLMALAFVFGCGMSLGDVVWGTLTQTRVPAEMRGRVASLDWFVSLSLFPVSFALTAPVSSLIGVQTTLIVAGLAGSALVATILVLVPALRAEETAPDEPPPAPASPTRDALYV
jgi:MFS family permease